MPKEPMSKKQASTEFYEQSQPDFRRSKTGLRRLRRACKALGLNDEETAHVEYLADYRPRPGAEVYPLFQI